jgi:quinol monooxygenase YgiN
MIGAYALLTIKDGSQADFEKVAAELVAAVNTNEPGCELYRLFKVRDSATQYAFMERYKDAAAVEAHRASEHFKRLGRAMGPLLDGPPVVTRMDQIA